MKLQVLTSGLYSFRIQRRVDGGSWTTVSSSTTSRSVTFNLATNHTYEFRVAARDKAGNWGAWSTAAASLVPTVGAVAASR